MKKSFKTILVLIAVLILTLICLLVYSKGYKKDDSVSNREIKENIENFNYTLDTLDSDVFKTEFLNLKEILTKEEIDYDMYAKSIAKLFVIDLYTIDTKQNKSDVGGTEYIYSTKQNIYERKMMDTLYKEVKDNKEGRKQQLPYVIEVKASEATIGEYEIDKKTVESYEVIVSVTYKEDIGYDSEIKLVMVRENEKLSIVEFSPVE